MRSEIKEIAPGLGIQKSDDGVWLHFKSSNGMYSAINLNVHFEAKNSHFNRGIVEWTQNYAKQIDENEKAKQSIHST